MTAVAIFSPTTPRSRWKATSPSRKPSACNSKCAPAPRACRPPTSRRSNSHWIPALRGNDEGERARHAGPFSLQNAAMTDRVADAARWRATLAANPEQAFATTRGGLSAAPRDGPLPLQAAHLCAEMGNAAGALQFAREADGLAPTDIAAGFGLCEALLAAGELAQADRIAAVLRAAQPRNQYAIALQATAWRLAGDPRYAQLHRYDTLVAAQRLAIPRGWTSLDAFLHDAAAELESMHAFTAHPLQQSVRGGSQLPLHAPELSRPAIAALFAGIGAAIEGYLAKRGPAAGFAISGAWGVRLRSGGYP